MPRWYVHARQCSPRCFKRYRAVGIRVPQYIPQYTLQRSEPAILERAPEIRVLALENDGVSPPRGATLWHVDRPDRVDYQGHVSGSAGFGLRQVARFVLAQRAGIPGIGRCAALTKASSDLAHRAAVDACRVFAKRFMSSIGD